MLCYKYMSYERFLGSITPEGVYLKVSRPCEFNDSFDCYAVVQGKLSNEFLKDYHNIFIGENSLYNYSEANVRFQKSLSMRCFFDPYVRVFSMCDAKRITKENEILMWGHYADNARGVRIELDINEKIFKPKRIKYGRDPVILYANKVKNCDWEKDPCFGKFLKDCLIVKSKAWKYEQELRLIFGVNSEYLKPWTIRDAKRTADKRNYVLCLDKAMIRGVSFGDAIAEKQKGGIGGVQEVAKSLIENGYKSTKFKLMFKGDDFSFKECNLLNFRE